MERTPENFLFDISDSSVEEDSASENATYYAQHLNSMNLVGYRKEIKVELSSLAKEMNLMLVLVYGFLCFNWYLMGIQWFPEPQWTPEIECEIKKLDYAQWTFYEKRNITSPKNDIYQPGCVYYDYNYLTLSSLTIEEAIEETLTKAKDTPILKCKNYVIKEDIPKEISHIREFNIFCIRRSLQFENVYMQIGVFVFGFPSGIMADRYGRRPVLNYCATLLCISAFVIPISINFLMFAAATFFFGGALYSVNIMLTIIFLELYRSKFRGFTLILSFLWFYVGFTHPTRFYNIVEVWRLRKLVVAFLHLISVFGAIMIIPESPRLLMIKRQFKTAWEWLHELGSTKISNGENFNHPEFAFGYQVKVLTKLYLQQRIYIAILLNGTATFFLYFFKNMKREILNPSHRLQFQFLIIQVILICITAVLTFFYSQKATMCTYYILLSVCIIINMFSISDIVADVSIHVGSMFSAALYILSYVYIMEIFPTSHRGSCMGCYITLQKLIQSFLGLFIYDLLAWENNIIFSVFFCGISMICALITTMSPATSDDIPDRKEDLFIRLPLDR